MHLHSCLYFLFFGLFCCSSMYWLSTSSTSEEPQFLFTLTCLGGCNWSLSLSVFSFNWKSGSGPMLSSVFLLLLLLSIDVPAVATGWIVGFPCRMSFSFSGMHKFSLQLLTYYYGHWSYSMLQLRYPIFLSPTCSQVNENPNFFSKHQQSPTTIFSSYLFPY